MNRRLQSSTARAEQSERAIDSPYLTVDEALVYLKLKTRSALYYHINHRKLPTLRMGSSYRFDRQELDAWLRGTTAIELVRARRA